MPKGVGKSAGSQQLYWVMSNRLQYSSRGEKGEVTVDVGFHRK